MKKHLIVVSAILLFSCAFYAQSSTPSPSPTPPEKESYENFTVNVKSAQISCKIETPEPTSSVPNPLETYTEVKLLVVFDQTIREIDRVASVSGKPELSNRYQGAAAYHLVKLETGAQLALGGEFVVDNTIALAVGNAAQFDQKKDYSLLVRGLMMKSGTPKENAVMIPVAVSSSCDKMPTEIGAADKITDKSPPALWQYAKDNFQPKASKPEVSVAFALNGEKPTRRFFETLVVAEPFELKRLGLRGAYSYVPFFLNLEKKGTADSEVDKLSFGSKFKHLLVFGDDGRYTTDRFTDKRVVGIASEISANFETTTKFKDPFNIVLGLKSGLPINVIQTRSQSLRVKPFVGFDYGYKILTPNATSKSRFIVRPSFGAELFYTPGRNETEAPFLFEASYILRAFLRPEEISTRDANRKVILEGTTSNPKHYVTAKFTLFQNKFISPFIRYTYGRDLPTYLLEDHKYSIGLQANFDWGAKK